MKYEIRAIGGCRALEFLRLSRADFAADARMQIQRDLIVVSLRICSRQWEILFSQTAVYIIRTGIRTLKVSVFQN